MGGKSGELQTVVDAARKTEIDGRKFYGKAAAASTSPLAKQMFEALAAAEEKHLEFIEALSRGEFNVVPYRQEFSRGLATVFSSTSEAERGKCAATESDTAALEFAIGMEDRSMAFYRLWAEKSSDETIRRFCTRMRDEEEDHWRLLQSTKDYLDDTGNWFMVQERWSFDGG